MATGPPSITSVTVGKSRAAQASSPFTQCALCALSHRAAVSTSKEQAPAPILMPQCTGATGEHRECREVTDVLIMGPPVSVFWPQETPLCLLFLPKPLPRRVVEATGQEPELCQDTGLAEALRGSSGKRTREPSTQAACVPKLCGRSSTPSAPAWRCLYLPAGRHSQHSFLALSLYHWLFPGSFPLPLSSSLTRHRSHILTGSK